MTSTFPFEVIMRPSSLGGGRILRRTVSVCLSVSLPACPSVPLSLPSVTSFRQPLASRTFRHALRAAYRTAISAAQILVLFAICHSWLMHISKISERTAVHSNYFWVYERLPYSHMIVSPWAEAIQNRPTLRIFTDDLAFFLERLPITLKSFGGGTSPQT